MKRKPIKVGFDFDGVIAYNPFRIVRYPLWYFKRNILGIRKLSFWYPHHSWQKIFWKILHESSVFPAFGVEQMKQAVETNVIEAHLISARYSFLDENLLRWLKKHQLDKYFTSININRNDEQPHVFKEKMVLKKEVSYYIEDNLDIVKHLDGKVSAEIYWIYNIVDRSYPYRWKYPYLQRALADILYKNTIKG